MAIRFVAVPLRTTNCNLTNKMRSGEISNLVNSVPKTKNAAKKTDNNVDDTEEMAPFADAQERFRAMKESTLLRRPVRQVSVDPELGQHQQPPATNTMICGAQFNQNQGIGMVGQQALRMEDRFRAMKESTQLRRPVRQVSVDPDSWQHKQAPTTDTLLWGAEIISNPTSGIFDQQEQLVMDRFQGKVTDKRMIQPRSGNNGESFVEAPADRFSFAALKKQSLLRRPVRQVSVQPGDEVDTSDQTKSSDDHRQANAHGSLLANSN